MSEEINLEASICTTEDAFEQFQATSMYEEEEFITLSDIVSPEPEPAAPLLPSDISDGVPYDNEVVLPSNCDEQDFTNKPGISNSDAVSISQNTLDNKLLLEQIPSQTDQELITRPKRGRKKKILENFVTDYPENSGPALDNNVQENPTSSTKTTSRSRRGRKPKQNVLAQNDTTLTGVNTDSLTDLINSSNTPRKGRKRLSENMQVCQLESQSTTKQTPGKRGRPKNNLTVQTPLETNEQLNDSKNIVSGESTHENSVDETVINNTSNDLEVNEEQKQIEDLEQQSEIGTKSEENVSSEITNSCTKKISTKRGRRKKKPQEEDSIESEQPFTKQRKVSEEEIATTLKQLGEGSHSADETQCDDLQQPSIEKGLKHEFDDDEDDGDDISLSKLKETLDTTVNNLSVEMDMELEENIHPESNPIQETAQEAIQTSEFKVIPNSTETTSAEDSNKVAEIPLSHENGDNDITSANPEESLLVEDLSRRPVRRRAKKILHYDEGSDEDPFANVELSDDEPRGKKNRKYDDDDDEYVPTEHKKGPHKIISSSSDSDISLAEDNLDGIIPKKKFRKNMTPKKRNSSFVSTSQDIKKEDNFITGSTVPPAIDLDHDDIEVCLEPSVIPTNEDKKSGLEFTSEFENFIANKIQGTNIKIKKVSSNQNSQRAPLEIPVLDPEAKKTVEISSQTDITKTTSVGSQTSTPYEVSMKKNVSLTAEQSDQACIFLKSIVKTTSELGQLMTEKSEDFITKKINTSNVTDTFKMDYCVKKSFLLLKLAKHNILQMETDLSKQYEEFLKRTKLIEHREEPKVIAPTETDSDCEIVEEPVKAKPEKPKFNPKTVFLNKELSIKIAKKPTVKSEPKCKSNLNIKDTHTVWISDSVMVKKVKPTQSFLAQDSRNKKPPDCYVTVKMVNDFFKNYYRKLAPTICAPFTSAEWLGQHKIYTCCYFSAKPSPSTEFPVTEEIYVANNANTSIAAIDNEPKYMENSIPHRTPESLLALCTYFLQKQLKMLRPNDEQKRHQISETKMNQKPRSLFRLCLNTLGNQFKFEPQNNNLTLKSKCEQQQAIEVPSLKVLCYKKMKDIFFLQSYKREPTPTLENESCILSIFNSNHISENIENHDTEPQNESVVPQNALSLKQLCHKKIMEYFLPQKTDNVSNIDYLDENSILSDSNILDCSSTTDNDNCVMECDSRATMNPLPLKSLCYRKVLELMPFQRKTDTLSSLEFLNEDSLLDSSSNGTSDNLENEDLMAALDFYTKYEPKSLFSLCVKWIQMQQKVLIEADTERHLYPEESVILSSFSLDNTLLKPKSLKEITFNNIKSIIFEESLCNLDKGIKIDDIQKVNKVKTLSNICYEMIMALTAEKSENVDRTDVALTINSVNTMSEEAFHNMDENSVQDDESNFYEDNNYEDDFNNFEEDAQQDDNNWVAQLQMKELRSCSLPNDTTESANINEINNVQEEHIQSRIKLEPIDELEQLVDSRIVKSEPIQNFDEMTVIPDSIVTKQEHIESAGDAKGIVRQNSSSFDVNSFENFVSHNKIMHPLDEPDDIFSQSGQRIRRQHEPDYNNEYDPALSLLIPQTFEPMSIETAKGRLMASSSDEETVNKKTQGKKKIDKKTKPKKVKKNETKQLNKEMPTAKEKIHSATVPALISEVAVLTRRMREKIRQEEKKIESSDSGEENVPIAIRKEKEKERKETERTKEKERKEIEKTKEKERKETEKTKENEKIKSLKNNKSKPDVEIQCNNVDSTEQLDSPNDSSENIKKFPGFSAVDQNEISSYEKYVKYVYNKILPKVSADAEAVPPELPECSTKAPELEMERPETPLIDYEDPVEMLECEPTMPIFDDTEQDVPIKKTVKNKKSKTDEKKKEIEEKSKTDEKQKEIEETKVVDEKPAVKDDEPAYCERQGWKCYKIDPNETKLYQNAAIILEKLPESFVETYFMYQSIADRDKEDEEVDRLTNLNSLNRYPAKEGKRPKGKSKSSIEGQHDKNATDMSRPTTPNSDGYAELTASEDESANVDDEIPPPAPRQSNENSLAKNSLMNDSDPEDAETQLKKEANDGSEQDSQHTKSKSKHKSKLKEEPKPDSESLMLTADKMMNKELNLLHAPVVLDDENTTPEKGNKKHSPRSKHKRGTRGNSSREHFKNDEDSSSEEEKQWVTTKEKLLKRMVKKYDTTGADDAKRAKLVSEFIQRRGGDMEVRRKRGKGRSGRLSARKKLEREKQMRVLSHELLGTPMDDNMAGPRGAHTQSYFKGRRNIRKVIDKKSLQRSTVIANMEEFERKKRLVQRQTRLREELGVEEGVSVLVINGEVCLEYSFEEQCPLVSVHPFFTKVMKAHQYEGVKFMWDACFETLEKLESGHPGGGCILAHCMGLGKTLQVLALLHTVLTHPRVGMQRVLVCCPLSTVLNWVDEIHKWIGPVTDQIKVFELSKLKKTYERAYQLEDWYNGGGIFIIGYELFRSLTTICPELDDVRPTIVNKIRSALLDPGPDIIICDEGHLLKNDASVLAVAMSRVVTKRRIVLTGTPMQNNLREYYCMVNFVKPNLLGTYSEYSNRFENPIMNGQHRDSQVEDIKLMKQRTHILHKVLEGCLQRQEASVLYPYLPKKHEYTVFISLTKVQWDLYKHYIENYSTKHKKNHGILKDFHTLQKIWSHPQVLHNFQMKARDDSDKSKIKPERLEDDLAHEDLAATEDIKPLDTDTWWLEYLDGGNMLDSLDTSNKFVVVFRILDECIALGDKVLIFSTSLITLDALEYFLKKINKWSLGQEYYRLDGSVPAEVRQKWCREFNAEHNHKTKLFLISTRAGCLGLNMVAANRVIIFDTSWNPAHDIQSIFRVYRFGQKKDCYIYRLVALGTMEQKIYERSVTKQAVSCRVVDEQQIDRHYNMAELTELYRYDEWGSSVAGGVAVGVCDVALLRVARLPALHAVHEHDSLLRGSTEQGLNEHERDAAWMQFQQEHAHKQMQNQLTSSFSMHISLPSLESAPPAATQPSTAGSSSVPTQPEIKTENTGQDNENNVALKTYTSKRGRPRKRIPSPPPVNSPEMEEEMVSKVMNLLIKHNFTTQSPTEIAKLVAKVRKMVADGTVPQGLDNESILAKSIANVLLMKDPKLEPLVEETEVKGLKKRGRKRKSDKPPEPEPEPVPEIQLPENTGRRRAALMAERQMASSDSIIDLDRDDDWQNDDWQPDPEDIQPNEPEVPVTERQPEISTLPVKQAISNISANASIVLSDDDEPTQKKVKVKAEKVKGKGGKAVVKSEPDSNVVPLHVSLLSNKNFIKIVAHTYLEGNPMLDEDAATLAAQYSTHKAKKEIESTGKMITSGPIYDIAIKVLGIDILKKLNKANPNLKPSVLPTEESSTQDVIVEQKPKPPAVQTKPKPAAVQTKPGPRLKAKGIAQLTNPPPVPGSSPEPKGISVVPVGLFNSAGGLAPSAPYSPEVREESILPDDDDVIVDDHPRPTFKRNAKPLVLNSVLAASAAKTHPTPTSISIPHPSRPPIPKLVISAGKLMPQSSYIATPQPSTAPIVTQPAPTLQQNTICLDSDEEETITPNIAPPKPSKRVALKSTAKPPVPVSITAANPHAYAGHVPPPGLQMPNPVNKPINLNIPGKNFVVIPASQIGKMTQLPPGVTPAMFNLAKASASQSMPMFQNVSSLPQNIVMAPQNIVMAPQSTIQSNIAPPRIVQSAPSESILPTQVGNAPKSSTKTVCKPGDILRVTSSGQIEILNRSEEAAPVLTTDTSLAKGRPRRNTQAVPTPVQPKMAPTSEEAAPVLTTETSLAKGRPRRNIQAAPTPVQPKTAPTPPAAPANPPPAPSKPEPPALPSPESSRVRKISSSSSSSDSRPSSPEDPLSILKDVVHIQAADYVTEPRKEKPKETTLVGSTSITRSSSSTPSKNEKTPLTTPTKPTSKAPTPAKMPTKSQDEIIKHISKTDTILKKLDNILAPSSISKSRSSIQKPAPKKPTTSVTSTSFVDVINLDDDLPSEPKSSTKSNHTRTSSTKTQAKVSAQSKTTALPKKVEGTSKNIILTMSGKTPSVSTTNASSSKGRVSNDKVLPTTSKSAPTKSTDPKKRQPPPPAASAPKKKKTEPMTLKDFNLDDIDDIIELD